MPKWAMQCLPRAAELLLVRGAHGAARGPGANMSTHELGPRHQDFLLGAALAVFMWHFNEFRLFWLRDSHLPSTH